MHSNFAIFVLVLLTATVSVRSLPIYTTANTINITVNAITVDAIRDRIIVAFGASIVIFDSNLEMLTAIAVSSKQNITSIAVSQKTGYIAALTHHHIHIYDGITGVESGKVRVSSAYYDLAFDDVNNAVVSIKYGSYQLSNGTIVFNGDPIYVSMTGKVMSRYRINNYYVADFTIDQRTGHLILSNGGISSYPEWTIAVANMSEVVSKFSVQLIQPAAGISIDENGTVIVGGFGIVLLSQNGSYVRLPDLIHEFTSTPRPYVDVTGAYIAYLSPSDENSYVQFIDYQGKKLMTIYYYAPSESTYYFNFSRNGTLVFQMGNQIKIWKAY